MNANGVITGLPAAGTYSIILTVTNANGIASDTLGLTVLSLTGYDAWVALQDLSGTDAAAAADPDHDGLPNWEEYALSANPRVPDRQQSLPRASLAQAAGENYLAVTYRRPKTSPPDVTYQIRSSSTLLPWQNPSNVTVVGTVDHGDYVETTVRSTIPARASSQGYLQFQMIKKF